MPVSLQSEDEAYYLCGVLNGMPVRIIVASYTAETEILTHILNAIKSLKYDPNNDLHRKISDLSRGVLDP